MVFIGQLDQAGHVFSIGGPQYYNGLNMVDSYVQGMINALNNTKTPTGNLTFFFILTCYYFNTLLGTDAIWHLIYFKSCDAA